MDIRPLTDRYAVSPQIAAEDIPAIAAAGYDTILCNRPDHEVEPGSSAASIQAAAEAAGLRFVDNPVENGGLTERSVATQRETLAGGGKVLAYCRSGTRSAVVWMLGAATDTPPAELIAAATGAGYALEHLQPQLEAIHRRG